MAEKNEERPAGASKGGGGGEDETYQDPNEALTQEERRIQEDHERLWCLLRMQKMKAPSGPEVVRPPDPLDWKEEMPRDPNYPEDPPTFADKIFSMTGAARKHPWTHRLLVEAALLGFKGVGEERLQCTFCGLTLANWQRCSIREIERKHDKCSPDCGGMWVRRRSRWEI